MNLKKTIESEVNVAEKKIKPNRSKTQKENLLFFIYFICYAAILGTLVYFFLMKYFIQNSFFSVIIRIDFLFSLTTLIYFLSSIAVSYTENKKRRYSILIFLIDILEVVLIVLCIRFLGLDNPVLASTKDFGINFYGFYITSAIILGNTIIYNIFTEVEDKYYYEIGIIFPILYLLTAFLKFYNYNWINYAFFIICFAIVIWHWSELFKDKNFVDIFKWTIVKKIKKINLIEIFKNKRKR